MFSWMGLLEASAAGGICIAVFFLASQLFGERYRVRYRKAVWLLIALRMCTPVSMSLLPQLFTVSVPVLVLGEGQRIQPEEGKGNVSAHQTAFQKEDQDGKASDVKENGLADTAGAGRELTSQDVLAVIWSCGSIAILSYYLLGHFLFSRRMMKRSVECKDEDILAVTAETAGKMGLKYVPQVRVIRDARTGPFTVGFFRNVIVLPKTGCQGKDLQYIIRHELAHCAAGDTRLKVLFLAVNVIHWFNPFAWIMKSLVNQDMELACDEKVLEDTSREERSEYSEILMSWIGTDKRDRSVFSTGYAEGVKFMKKRFRNIFNVQKKSGRTAMCIFVFFLMAISASVGFEAGRTVNAANRIAIDSGIELRTDVTGDGRPDQVQVRDNNDLLTTSLSLRAADGREEEFTYDEELWAASCITSGDLSGNGAADIVLLRTTFGMHGDGPVSVLHVTEEAGTLIWKEYSRSFIHNPAIEGDQPGTFDDIGCVNATVIEEEGRHYLRLTVLDMEKVGRSDDDEYLNIDCSLEEEGWFIRNIQPDEPAGGHDQAYNELEEIVMDFCQAYFEGNVDSIKFFLTDPYIWDIEVYDGSLGDLEILSVKGLEDAVGKNVDDACIVSVEYKTSDTEGAYIYLTISFVKTETGWKIEFYGWEG